MYVCTHMYVCMYVSMYVCMYVCMSKYVAIYYAATMQTFNLESDFALYS